MCAAFEPSRLRNPAVQKVQPGAVEQRVTLVRRKGAHEEGVLAVLQPRRQRTGMAGRLRRNRIKIMTGDRVSLELSPYDLTKGRITYRFK